MRQTRNQISNEKRVCKPNFHYSNNQFVMKINKDDKKDTCNSCAKKLVKNDMIIDDIVEKCHFDKYSKNKNDNEIVLQNSHVLCVNCDSIKKNEVNKKITHLINTSDIRTRNYNGLQSYIINLLRKVYREKNKESLSKESIYSNNNDSDIEYDTLEENNDIEYDNLPDIEENINKCHNISLCTVTYEGIKKVEQNLTIRKSKRLPKPVKNYEYSEQIILKRGTKRKVDYESDSDNKPSITSIKKVDMLYKQKYGFKILTQQKSKCKLCNTYLDENFIIDHIVPKEYIKLYGDKINWISNLQGLCLNCNRIKTYKVDHMIHVNNKNPQPFEKLYFHIIHLLENEYKKLEEQKSIMINDDSTNILFPIGAKNDKSDLSTYSYKPNKMMDKPNIIFSNCNFSNCNFST